MAYAVIKVVAATQDAVACLGHGMLYHHADGLIASRGGPFAGVQEGHYLKAVNEHDARHEQTHNQEEDE